MNQLSGKVAVVTGAGRGIGAAAAVELAREGARVVVSARRAADAERVARRIAAAGGQATAIGCDVADFAAVQALTATAVDRFGAIDVLVNNAGTIQPIGILAETDPSLWSKAIEINLVGAYHTVRAVLPIMLAHGGGIIINLSSGAAHRPLEGWSAYCASKAGLAMLTRSIHHEYGAADIVAVGFAPGVVDTDMQGEIRASGVNPVSRLPREALHPVEEPARAIAWLASPAARAYAGQEVDIRDPEFRQAVALV